ncbi:class I SAM-dependent methyltransferase [Rhodococcus koreensis]|uniref:class I SAM-dependent methyltransferase n=1 Tax=Rhodococcus koreensis TaxID=99653 RepID=UPI0036DC3C57
MSQQPDEFSKPWPPHEDRDRVHWNIERALREELLASTRDTREVVTRDVYNRLFKEVPWHKAHVTDTASEDAYEEGWFQQYGALTRPTDTLVDAGCGRGGLIRRFAPAVSDCIGIDASDAMVKLAEQKRPANARFILGSVLNPPLPPSSADFIVSRQVMEHLHPDDVPEHLAAVLRILRPGGRFLIETPSRLTGPWDISRGFTPVATGFHLREYTNGELGAMLREAGFRRVRSRAVPSRILIRLGRTRRHAYVPVALKAIIERALQLAPMLIRTKLAGPLSVREVILIAERR